MIAYRTRDDIVTLESLLDKVPDRNKSFAMSLIGQARGGKLLSPSQTEWVEKLCRAARGEDMTTGKKFGADVSVLEANAIANLKSFFARSGLKQPKIIIAVGEHKVKFNVSGERIYVAAPTYGGNYYGRIDEGFLRKGRDVLPEGTWEALAAFLADPAKVAREYGYTEHHCCFCAEPLTDQRSVDAGYGPICAGHYGLPWGKTLRQGADDNSVDKCPNSD